MKRGLTLVEVLICIAIVALLAALILPAFVSAKRSAMVTDETSRLRQLGAAFALYENQYGIPHYDVGPLVDLGLVPSTLLSSPLDPTPNGMGNAVANLTHQKLPHMDYELPYRSSFPSFLAFGQFNETFATKIDGKAGAGWAISLSTCRPLADSYFVFTEHCRYQRLLTDGAVVRRTASGQRLDSQSIGYSPYTMFADFTPGELSDLFK